MTDASAGEAVSAAKRDDESFDAFYARAVEPALRELETMRRRAVTRFALAIGGGVIGAGTLAGAAVIGGWFEGPVVILPVAIFFVGVMLALAALADASGKVKAALMPRIADFLGVRYWRVGGDVSAIERFRAHKLVPSYHRSSFEDFLAGEHAGCSFVLFEAHLKQRSRDSKGRTKYVTCFQGQLLRLTAPMTFLGVTVILRDAGIFNAFLKPANELKRVGLVDPRFEKVFEVFSSDQVEARYLLSPVFMERLLHLEDLLRGKKVRAAFAAGEILIAVEGGNLFEAGSMFKPLADPARARRVHDEISTVHGVIDALIATKRREPDEPPAS